MYDYPIYKHLIQFSLMVDSNGHLNSDEIPTANPQPPKLNEEAKG